MRKLFKFSLHKGNENLMKLFNEETIQGEETIQVRKLYEEIRYACLVSCPTRSKNLERTPTTSPTNQTKSRSRIFARK